MREASLPNNWATRARSHLVEAALAVGGRLITFMA